MSKLIFIKNETEFASVDSEALSHMEYTTISGFPGVALYFDLSRSGTKTTLEVKLLTTGSNPSDVVASLTSLFARSGQHMFTNIGLATGKFNYDGTAKVSAGKQYASDFVTSVSALTFTEGTIAQGPQGPQGPAGADAEDDKVFLDIRVDEAVSKGDPLYITGYNSGQNRITVAKADAADSAKMPSIGLASAAYSTNDNGRAITMGSFVDVDTSSFSEGDVLYVAATGGLTATKPTGTNLIQNVGKVGRSNQNNGEIVVMAIGRSNDVPNIPDGQAWIGNASGVATPTTLANVATSGSYVDLSNKPTISNLGDTDLTADNNRVYDQDGNSLEIETNSGDFTLTNTTHTYIEASSNDLTLQGLRFPSSDGNKFDLITTNGLGVLSFATPPIIPIANISGRYTWGSTDDGERVYTGSTAYGPYNWYNFSLEPGSNDTTLRDYTGSEVVGTTTETLSSYLLFGNGIKNAFTGYKVRIDYSFRIYSATAPTTNTPFGLSLWSGDAGTTGESVDRTITYRGESSDHGYNSSLGHHFGSFTTANTISDDYLLILAEHRDSTGLNNTTYMYANFSVYLVNP